MVVLDRFFSFGGQKKAVAGRVRQVVVLYSNVCMGIGLGGLWSSSTSGRRIEVDCITFSSSFGNNVC